MNGVYTQLIHICIAALDMGVSVLQYSNLLKVQFAPLISMELKTLN